MNRNDFRQLVSNRHLLLDGATGTHLQAAGMPAGVSLKSGFWIIRIFSGICRFSIYPPAAISFWLRLLVLTALKCLAITHRSASSRSISGWLRSVFRLVTTICRKIPEVLFWSQATLVRPEDSFIRPGN